MSRDLSSGALKEVPSQLSTRDDDFCNTPHVRPVTLSRLLLFAASIVGKTVDMALQSHPKFDTRKQKHKFLFPFSNTFPCKWGMPQDQMTCDIS